MFRDEELKQSPGRKEEMIKIDHVTRLPFCTSIYPKDSTNGNLQDLIMNIPQSLL